MGCMDMRYTTADVENEGLQVNAQGHTRTRPRTFDGLDQLYPLVDDIISIPTNKGN